jgi:membrane-bound ClpP family serine protease
MLRRVGILGIVGIAVFLVWFVGWIFLGKHDGLWHVLMLAGVVLMLAQAVRRVIAT